MDFDAYITGAAIPTILALVSAVFYLANQRLGQQDMRGNRLDGYSRQDTTRLARLEALIESSNGRRPRYADRDDLAFDPLDIIARLARLEEFRDEAKEKLDEQGRALRAVTRLEEQFNAFRETVSAQLSRIERRWEPALMAVSKAMETAVAP